MNDYVTPRVVDYGTLEDLTAACILGPGQDTVLADILPGLFGSQPLSTPVGDICVPGEA